LEANLDELLKKYGALLGEVDGWFARCLDQHPGELECRLGCAKCCRGLFDITLLDALYLRSGFEQLPENVRVQVAGRAQARLTDITRSQKSFDRPWVLNDLPESEWDAIMPDEDERACVFLSDDNVCLVYSHRPMTCRLHGIPMVDRSGEVLFNEWCTLNFLKTNPLMLPELRFHFSDIFAQELLLFREMTRLLTGVSFSELDTLIPAACFLDAELLDEIAARSAARLS